MKKFAKVIALLLAVGLSLPASAIEVLDNSAVTARHAGSHHPATDSKLLTTPGLQTMTTSSELPEPEVFAMMLLGLVLIGWRVRRDSSDKFQ